VTAAIVLFMAITTMLYPAGDSAPQNESQGTGFSLPTPDDSGGLARDIMGIVFYIVVGILIIVILYKLFKALPAKFRSMYQKIHDLIKGKLIQLFSNEVNNDEYSDEVEVVRPDDANTDTASVRNELRKQRRNISRIKDPVQKVRYSYLAIMTGLRRHKIEILKSDTTGEIYGKSLSITGIDKEFKKITALYDKVRYDDRVPDEKALDEMEASLDEVTHRLKK
jgi:hypothetical protein